MRRWKALPGFVLAAALMGLGACADGYPTDDGALVLSHGMSREATLKAMNTIGHHGYLEHRWRYALDADCHLRVRSKGLETGDVSLHAASPGLFTRVVVAGESAHLVFVHVPDAASKSGALVLGEANNFDAGQMKWLIDHLGNLCRSAGASPGSG